MKRIFLLIICFIVVLASCSNPQSSVLTLQDNTLRTAVQEKNNKTIWTKEIEPDRLNTKLNTQIKTTNKELITPQMMSTIKAMQKAVYPEIKDFASLDCSKMNKTLLQKVSELCDSLCNGTDKLIDYFDSGYFYNCVFFINDINEIIPQEEVKENEEKPPLFDKYLICQGFEGENIIQVPVRFYKGKETLDLSVFLAYHGEYKVIQIEILGWGKLNGESEKTE